MPAQNIRRLDFSDVHLYAVTPDVTDASSALSRIEKWVVNGVDAIQLRSRSLTDRAYLELGQKVKQICFSNQVLFLVDNRVDLALVLDADGVHVGHTDIPARQVREMIGHRKILGVSTHSVTEALEAQKLGADYVSCGPLWATPTKPEYPAVGLGLVGLYRAALRVPFVAIGGIDESNISQVVAAGADRVAIVRALYEAADPGVAAQKFKNIVQPKVEVMS